MPTYQQLRQAHAEGQVADLSEAVSACELADEGERLQLVEWAHGAGCPGDVLARKLANQHSVWTDEHFELLWRVDRPTYTVITRLQNEVEGWDCALAHSNNLAHLQRALDALRNLMKQHWMKINCEGVFYWAVVEVLPGEKLDWLVRNRVLPGEAWNGATEDAVRRGDVGLLASLLDQEMVDTHFLEKLMVEEGHADLLTWLYEARGVPCSFGGLEDADYYTVAVIMVIWKAVRDKALRVPEPVLEVFQRRAVILCALKGSKLMPELLQRVLRVVEM